MKIIRKFYLEREKKLFLIFGVFNFLITNSVLHILLLLVPTILATVVSQIVNVILGYYLYGTKVFNKKTSYDKHFKKYIFLAFVLWTLNFLFIQTFFLMGVNKNFTAILIIPPLVVISFLTQKNYVFK